MYLWGHMVRVAAIFKPSKQAGKARQVSIERKRCTKRERAELRLLRLKNRKR